MPTLKEIKSLLQYYTSEWTTVNGISGRKFTSAINGNSIFLPTAGCNWDDGLSYRDSWGYYWSGTLYPDNEWRAGNLGFGSRNAGYSRWSERSVDHYVRPVAELTPSHPADSPVLPFTIILEQLLADLIHAYYDARRHKRRKVRQIRFEIGMEAELVALRDELWNRSYHPRPSTCFIVHDPKQREIFAADFRDRVVHHLLYNYIPPLWNARSSPTAIAAA